jgi:eukaryotic-like serine/threonine-protein kinase
VAQILGGRYELEDVIGRGGMGVVYRGRDRVLDRTVAVKVLPALFAENPTLVERFEREARAAARLTHPNIVSVYDTGQDRTERYIVMEYVAGMSLAELLHERGPLPAREAVDLSAQIAEAMTAAHAAGIVHRDIKPANVMVLPSGEAKVLDFGIARATADAALTRTTMVLGSAPYIAPEVALGRSADARSDIYSLGCVLYEMLTRRPPFTGDLPAVVMSQHTSADPRPPHELTSGVPGGLEALVLQMLAKNPDDRPQRASELPAALRAALTDPTAATRVVPAPVPTAPTAPTAPTQVAAAEAAGPRRPVPRQATTSPRGPAPTAAESDPGSGIGARAWLVAAVLILAVAAGVAIALAASSGSGSKSASSTAHSSTTAPRPSTTTHTSRYTSSSTTPTSTTTRSQTTTTHSSSTSSTTTPTTGSTSTTVTVPKVP